MSSCVFFGEKLDEIRTQRGELWVEMVDSTTPVSNFERKLIRLRPFIQYNTLTPSRQGSFIKQK